MTTNTSAHQQLLMQYKKLGENMFTKLLSTFLIMASVMTATMSFAGEKIVFGIISTESSQNLRKNWTPLIDDMSEQTGYDVQAFFAPDYAGVIEAMRFNKVQIAWFGNKSAMEAVDRANGEIFARVINSNGTEGYTSLIITNTDTGIDSIEEMFEKAGELSFGNGDPNSTSGYTIPAYYVFAAAKKDPKKIFKNVVTANHETNALSVINKKVEVATYNNIQYANITNRMPEKAAKLKVLWESPLIPSDPIVRHKDLDPKAKQAILDFMVNYGKTEREQEILKKLNRKGFAASSNDQLIPIRQIDLFNKKTRLEANTTMNADERKEKIAELDRKLKELEAKSKKIATKIDAAG